MPHRVNETEPGGFIAADAPRDRRNDTPAKRLADERGKRRRGKRATQHHKKRSPRNATIHAEKLP